MKYRAMSVALAVSLALCPQPVFAADAGNEGGGPAGTVAAATGGTTAEDATGTSSSSSGTRTAEDYKAAFARSGLTLRNNRRGGTPAV